MHDCMMYRLITKLMRSWWQIAGRFLLWSRGVSVGPGCVFYGLPIVDICPGLSIVIGARVVLCSDARFTVLGVNHPVVLRTLTSSARLVIGDDCGISGASICAAERVEIGCRVLMGSNAMVFDTDFHARSPNNRRGNADWREIAKRPVCVGDDVFIGAAAIVTKGVQIESGSIVGAGAVVVKDVAAGVIVAGNPARYIGDV